MRIKDENAELKIGITIFLVLLFSYFYFMQAPHNANSFTRAALALALLEEGTVKINKYHEATIDKAYYKGDFYSDKAPGLAFTALPSMALAHKLIKLSKTEKWINDTGKMTPGFKFLKLIGVYGTSALFTAATAAILFFLALRLGSSSSGAVFAALSFGLATPAWGWATSFFGHALAGSCLFLGFAAIVYLNLKEPNRKRDITLGFLAGAVLAWAVVVEYPAAIASGIISIYGLTVARHWKKERLIRTLISAFAGSAIFITPLLLYNHAAFGSPFATGYRYVILNIHPGMSEGFLGFAYPKLDIVYEILFGGFRGIAWISPILLIFPLALYRYWKILARRGEAITITALLVYYILWNSSYYYWDGGWSTGPRHLTPVLPFLCLPLAVLWTSAGLKLKTALLALFTVSFIISLICVSVTMASPPGFDNTLLDYLIPQFLIEGPSRIVIRNSSAVDNVLQNIGVHSALIPLFIVLLSGWFYILVLLKKSGKSLP